MKESDQSIVAFDAHEQEHANLEKLLATWGAMVAEKKANRNDVSVLLAGLIETLQSHFDHEEHEQGFFKTVVKQAPWLSEQAQTLMDEHCGMCQMLERVHSHAQEDSPHDAWWTKHTDEFQQFRRSFLRHERSENDLLQQAFTQDIGSND